MDLRDASASKKCWYKLICNGTYWLLLTGHFGLVFIRLSQWSITAVGRCRRVSYVEENEEAFADQQSQTYVAFEAAARQETLSAGACGIQVVLQQLNLWLLC